MVLLPCEHYFEIKSSILNIMPNFNELPNQNPYDHFMEFQQACTTVKLNGLPENTLSSFSFFIYIKRRCKEVAYQTFPSSIHFRIQLQEVFLIKYFLPSKDANFCDNLVGFKLFPNDTFHKTWERFKNLDLSCSHHGLDKWLLVDLFYLRL